MCLIFMTVCGRILVENDVDEGSKLPFATGSLFSFGIKTIC